MVTSYNKNQISKAPADTLFFNRDFINYGSRGAVDMCLKRLVKKGFIERLASGIYVRHDCKRNFSAFEIGQAKAHRFNRSLIAHPLDTGHSLNFTKYLPTDAKFYSQGRPSSFQTTQGRVSFFPASPRRVALNALKTGAKINALWWLKKEGVSEQHIYDVLCKLTRTEKEELLWAHDLMPGWLSDLVHKSCDGKLFFPLKGK